VISTLKEERGSSIVGAFEHWIATCNAALEQFDALALPLSTQSVGVERWIESVRFASLGFTIWEAQAPRYTAYKVVSDGMVVEPKLEVGRG
jgi:hypothetical protein